MAYRDIAYRLLTVTASLTTLPPFITNVTFCCACMSRRGSPSTAIGSDIVMLFLSKQVVIDAKVGTKYLQGQRIGKVR